MTLAQVMEGVELEETSERDSETTKARAGGADKPCGRPPEAWTEGHGSAHRPAQSQCRLGSSIVKRSSNSEFSHEVLSILRKRKKVTLDEPNKYMCKLHLA